MKKLDNSKLEIILGCHEIWLETHKKEGKQAMLISLDLRGVDFSLITKNQNLKEVFFIGSNLEGVDLIGFNLEGAHLHSANLSHADLSEANLRNTGLKKANLSYANLSNADLSHADLREANLESSNLEGTFLNHTKLYKTNLKKANIVNSNNALQRDLLCPTTFDGANLKGAIFSENITLDYFV